MADYKNNHYVPEFILKRFSSEKGEFFYYNKIKRSPIAHRNISKVFCAKRIFWGTDIEGKEDKTLESDFYSEMDSAASVIVDRMVGCIRSGMLPSLTMTQKRSWDDFIFFQMKRLPGIHRLSIQRELLDQSLRSIVSEIEKSSGPLSEEQISEIRYELEKEENLHNAKIYALRSHGDLSQGLLRGRGLVFARIVKANKSFLIGDAPFTRPDPPLINDGSGMTSENWFPISSDIAVSHFDNIQKEMVIEIDVSQIRRINEMIYKSSNEIGSSSARLLASIGNLPLPAGL